MLSKSLNNLSSFHNPHFRGSSNPNQAASLQSCLRDEMKESLNAIQGLGLTIELCGSWVWVFEANPSHEAKLRAAHFNWSYRKGCWYLRPKSNAPRLNQKSDRKSWDDGKIQAKYGSQALQV